MFERENLVFAGVVFTLDTHNHILRTGCHTAVAAIGNVGYHVNDSTAYNSSYCYILAPARTVARGYIPGHET